MCLSDRLCARPFPRVTTWQMPHSVSMSRQYAYSSVVSTPDFRLIFGRRTDLADVGDPRRTVAPDADPGLGVAQHGVTEPALRRRPGRPLGVGDGPAEHGRVHGPEVAVLEVAVAAGERVIRPPQHAIL